MASRLSLICVMLIVTLMMTTVTLPVAAHRLLPNPTNHFSDETTTNTMPELRNPKRALLQIDVHPTVGAVPVAVGGVLPGVTGLLPILPP
ncbi:hypothetical protein SOVF_188290 [Spinacia oleracea]|nr:hypothetical protein SOVF_188290 [Spinacia oleracea]